MQARGRKKMSPALMREIYARHPDLYEEHQKWNPPKKLTRRYNWEYWGGLFLYTFIFGFAVGDMGILLRLALQVPGSWGLMYLVGIRHAHRLRGAGYDHLRAARLRRVEKWWISSGLQERQQRRQVIKLARQLQKK